MSSQEIKERIEHYFNCTGVPTSEKDWKRVRKFKLPNCSYDIREFHNATLGRTIYTVGDDEDAQILELDQWIYGVGPMEDNMKFGGQIGNLYICFEPLDRWNRTRYVFDQHQEHLLRTFFHLPAVIGEDMENSFSYDGTVYNDLTIHLALKKLGFQHSSELSDFLQNQTSYPVLPATPPINPPLPPALAGTPAPNVTPVAPTAAPSVSTPTGYYGTGLEADGSPTPADFLFTVFTEDGLDVNVAFTPLQDFLNGGSFDQSIGPILDHLIPNDWDEHMEQYYTPGTLTASQAYDFLEQAGFQRSDKHDAMFDDEESYEVYKPGVSPTHSGLVASDFLFTIVDDKDGWTHVAIGLRRVWDDDEELTDKPLTPLVGHLIPGDWTEVEDGLFKCGNLAIQPVVDLMHAAGFEEDDEFQDRVAEEFAAASIGWTGPTSNAAPISAPPMPRPTPRIGPSPSQITGSGSFAAPVVPGDEEEPEEAVLPEVHLENDAGDEKVKFRKEFWDAWQAKDPSITTLRLRWYDRYRERKAEVTGLGFAYHLPEYTGVKLLMGYLDEEGKLIDNVTLPVSVVEEIFKDYGGEFEGGQVQFVYKKPDTSAQDLWEELEPMLIAMGWTNVS